MLPVPATTGSLKVVTRFAPVATLAALSAGIVEKSTGAAVVGTKAAAEVWCSIMFVND